MKEENKIDIEPIKWWESKRLIYNFSIAIGALIAYLVISTSSKEFNLVALLIWVFGANVFYTMSWAFELLCHKGYRKYPFNNNYRKIIFTIGTLFSVWWTCIGLQSWH